jgi:uncharacterized membrane protein
VNEHRGHPLLWILFGVVALLVIIGAIFALFYFFTPTMPMRGFGYYYWWPAFPFGFIAFFVVLFLIFGAFRWAFWGWGWRRRWYYGYGDYADPHQILKRRYAKGEITKDQFDQMMRDLEQRS